jgi:ADP-heptose:LPS heptosyltransferase
MDKGSFSFKKWDKKTPPEKVLVIRFHAIGDTALCLPACSSLKKKLHFTEIDLLTGERAAPLAEASGIFNNVYSFKDYSNSRSSIMYSLDRVVEVSRKRPIFRHNNYDIVLDLQNNRISRMVRFFSGVRYYSEFDKFSPNPAAARVLNTFLNAGFDEIENDCHFDIGAELLTRAKHILFENGWDGRKKLVVLNPAGLWPSRNWPIDNYVSLAELMGKSGDTNFLFIGDKQLREKGKYLKERIGASAVDLTCKTTLDEVLAIFHYVNLTISEDSALIHISWASGVPTLALLGSTRADWTSPLPPHGASLNSSDLECGNCMQEICRFGDVHCLTRYTPEIVMEKMRATGIYHN